MRQEKGSRAGGQAGVCDGYMDAVRPHRSARAVQAMSSLALT